MSEVIAISGIDTDIGKTVVAGLMARALQEAGISVITQKLVQTGGEGLSEDILSHRQVMGTDPLPEDLDGTSCPYVFPYPASPHLAASLAKKQIDVAMLQANTARLASKYAVVLLEGAGGLHVPLTPETLFVDYLEAQRIPLVLVTGPRLGSINHTLMSLEIAAKRNIRVRGLVYNLYGQADTPIKRDSAEIFLRYLAEYGFTPRMLELQELDVYQKGQEPLPDFSIFLENDS